MRGIVVYVAVIIRGFVKRSLLFQTWLLFGILLANFAAQVLYFYHLYYTPQHPLPDLQSAVVMGAIFAVFLASFILLMTKHKLGYYAMLIFLSAESLFYLWNIVGGVRHGLGWFFHLGEPDPILWVVFGIGYLSFFASAYFLALLLFQGPPEAWH